MYELWIVLQLKTPKIENTRKETSNEGNKQRRKQARKQGKQGSKEARKQTRKQGNKEGRYKYPRKEDTSIQGMTIVTNVTSHTSKTLNGYYTITTYVTVETSLGTLYQENETIWTNGKTGIRTTTICTTRGDNPTLTKSTTVDLNETTIHLRPLLSRFEKTGMSVHY